jgi:hypothetical protein
MLLELAATAREPNAAEKLRVWGALRERLGTPGPQPETASSESAPRVEAGPSAAPPVGTPRETRARMRQLVGVGVTTGVLGFLLGLTLQLHTAATPIAALPSLSAAPRVGSAESAGPSDALRDRAMQARIEPVATEHATLGQGDAHMPAKSARDSKADEMPATSERRAGPRNARLDRVSTRAARRAGAPVTTSTAAPFDVSDPAFLEAVRLLQRAQRFVDGEDAVLAMRTLEELDRRFPGALLKEERRATRVLALCESGQTDRAIAEATALRHESPDSIYNARLARSCAGNARGQTR